MNDPLSNWLNDLTNNKSQHIEGGKVVSTVIKEDAAIEEALPEPTPPKLEQGQNAKGNDKQPTSAVEPTSANNEQPTSATEPTPMKQEQPTAVEQPTSAKRQQPTAAAN